MVATCERSSANSRAARIALIFLADWEGTPLRSSFSSSEASVAKLPDYHDRVYGATVRTSSHTLVVIVQDRL